MQLLDHIGFGVGRLDANIREILHPAVLRACQTDDLHAVPGVDAVQAISLERITDNPSEAYTIFIRAWLGLVTESSLRRAEPRDE